MRLTQAQKARVRMIKTLGSPLKCMVMFRIILKAVALVTEHGFTLLQTEEHVYHSCCAPNDMERTPEGFLKFSMYLGKLHNHSLTFILGLLWMRSIDYIKSQDISFSKVFKDLANRGGLRPPKSWSIKLRRKGNRIVGLKKPIWLLIVVHTISASRGF